MSKLMRVPKLERLIDRAECMAAESAENGFVCTAMDLRAFAAALGAFLPEERVGRCWCETFVWGEWRAEQFGWEIIPAADPSTEDTPRWCNDANIEHDCKFCFDCGAHLGTDGIARRNAAVRQVERVLEALGECEHAGRICLDSGIGQGGDSYLIWWCTQCGAVASDRREAGHDEWIKGGFLQVNTPQTTKAIRAALDGGAPDATHD
jgi:hypothetical protein